MLVLYQNIIFIKNSKRNAIKFYHVLIYFSIYSPKVHNKPLKIKNSLSKILKKIGEKNHKKLKLMHMYNTIFTTLMYILLLPNVFKFCFYINMMRNIYKKK